MQSMLQEKKAMIAARLKKTIDSSNTLLIDINSSLETILKDNKEIVVLGNVFGAWMDKLNRN